MDHERNTWETLPLGYDQDEPYPVIAQRRVLNALQQDVESGRHLLCVTGPPGSGKTVLLHELQQVLDHCRVVSIEQPMPGKLLAEIAKAMQLNAVEDNEVILRRKLVIELSMAEEQRRPVVLIIDDADSISADDFDLLLHFFPSGHTSLILAGAASPESWPANDANPSGGIHFDRTYSLDPRSTDETAELTQQDAHDISAAEEFISSFQAEPDLPVSLLDDEISAEMVLEPVDIPARSKAGSWQPESDTAAGAHAAFIRAEQERSLRLSIRRWRMTAVLVSLALVAVLSRDALFALMPPVAGFHDRVAGLFTGPRHLAPSLKPPGETVQSARPPQPDVAPVVAGAESHTDFAAMFPSASLHEEEDPLPDREVIATAPAAAPEPEAETAPVPAEANTDAQEPTLNRAQRKQIAQLYADRALYEWENGDLESALTSIRYGLTTDPGNPQLLDMRARLTEVMRRN